MKNIPFYSLHALSLDQESRSTYGDMREAAKSYESDGKSDSTINSRGRGRTLFLQAGAVTGDAGDLEGRPICTNVSKRTPFLGRPPGSSLLYTSPLTCMNRRWEPIRRMVGMTLAVILGVGWGGVWPGIHNGCLSWCE